MEKNKRIIIFIMLAALLFSFSGCSQAESVYDDNVKIAENFDTVVATRYVQNSQSLNNTLVIYSHAEYFSGAEKICEITFTENTIFNVELTVTEGKFKIVLISQDKNVYTLFENGEDLLIDLSEIPAGDYTLKFVGKAAEFELNLEISPCDIF